MSDYHILHRLSENVSDHGSHPTIKAAQDHADQAGHAGAAVFHYVNRGEIGGGRGFVDSIREPGQGWVSFRDPYGLHAWWWRLPEGVRAVLVADPDATLSEGILSACVHAGLPVTSDAWWVDSQPGPSGFRIPEDVRAFIRAVSA
ncbi:hypothetical protein [Brachybacterium massiliense]|uniref:hypothetical protein n=1 Tax=Brachybacterium massiliense TaxID=1755098 RepID=UPI000B3BB254|nr:hypothetical protein [Brachybacterium massiliense]